MKIVTKANRSILTHGASTVLLSYSVPVAYHVAGSSPVRSGVFYSPTTTKHVNSWLRETFGRPAAIISEAADQEAFSREATAALAADLLAQ